MALVCLCRGNFYWPPHTTILFCSIFLDKIVLDTLKSRYHRSAPLGMEMYDTTILSSDHLYLSIGRNIRHLRKKKNLTQDQLAELIDGDQKYISRIESGKAKASLLYYLKIANALCVSLDYLLIDCISAHYGLEGADDLFQNFIGETEEQLAREILIAIQHYLQRKE